MIALVGRRWYARPVMDASINLWLQSLGYDGSIGVVHRSAQDVRPDHPYAREIDLLLRRNGDVRSAAVFEVDRVPAVCFIEPTSRQLMDPHFVSEVRRKIWNQNLVSILIVVRGDQATAYPAPRLLPPESPLSLADARADGRFSAADVASGEIHSRLPNWFDRRYRVDRVMQDNLSAAVELLEGFDLSLEQAQLLLGKCIFVSYLEDREIVGQRYRKSRKTRRLLELLEAADGAALHRYFRKLKEDFNGDLLEIEGGANVDWQRLDTRVFGLLKEFLLQTRLRDGQASLWPYDFKYIPVELLSGIYESFLNDEQRSKGAVYTPRHLAALAVDEAFRGIKEPWKEVVLDGACGSGILLTTAYRRMLGAKRAAQTRALSYEQRRSVLMSGIRGGDISAAATKVTAFSLYLALLEDLTPSDIALLQEDRNVKMPPLIGEVLARDGEGDFFDDRNVIAKPGSATIALSNPPWFEPKEAQGPQLYETWWRAHNDEANLPLRQIALAFAQRATDALVPGGRLCLILPTVCLAAANAGPYLKSWFGQMAPQRVFNFADMRRVLFDGAVHPTAVVVGTRRESKDVGRIPVRESFEYLAPKADISLAFGRLTVHSFDRKQLHTHVVADDAELLRTYFWGAELDESLVARLRLSGTFKDHAAKDSRFVICKGFHATDSSKDASWPGPLQDMDFLSTARGASKFPRDRLFVRARDLEPFPDRYETVADYGSKGGQAFSGVRVIFPDGADSDSLEIRACYADAPFCFTQTVGAIVDTQGDRLLMQFVATYLRSKLARYLMVYTAFSVTMERPHVKLKEIEKLPFLLPEDHRYPARAQAIIRDVAALLAGTRSRKEGAEEAAFAGIREALDDLVFDYFELTPTERQVVNDTCDFLVPSMQPSSLASLNQPLHHAPTEADCKAYSALLRSELELWRERLKGEGRFAVQWSPPASRHSGATGIVQISLTDKTSSSRKQTPHEVELVMRELRGLDSYPTVGSEVMSVASDFLLFHGGDYFFVKPMVKRLWLAGAAAHDALRIVQTVRSAMVGH